MTQFQQESLLLCGAHWCAIAGAWISFFLTLPPSDWWDAIAYPSVLSSILALSLWCCCQDARWKNEEE